MGHLLFFTALVILKCHNPIFFVCWLKNIYPPRWAIKCSFTSLIFLECQGKNFAKKAFARTHFFVVLQKTVARFFYISLTFRNTVKNIRVFAQEKQKGNKWLVYGVFKYIGGGGNMKRIFEERECMFGAFNFKNNSGGNVKRNSRKAMNDWCSYF